MPAAAGPGQHRADAGHHLDRDAGPDAGEDLLAAAAEHEGVAALEPHHPQPPPGPVDQHRGDLLLAGAGPVRRLADVDHLDPGREPVQQHARGQPVHHHHVGLGEQAAAPDGDQLRVAGAAADQRDAAPAGRRPARPQRQLAGLQQQRHGVAHRAYPGRVRAVLARHRDQ